MSVLTVALNAPILFIYFLNLRYNNILMMVLIKSAYKAPEVDYADRCLLDVLCTSPDPGGNEGAGYDGEWDF